MIDNSKIKETAKNKLKVIEQLFKNESINYNFNKFIEKYILCENMYKLLLISYKQSRNEIINMNSLKVSMNTAPSVMKYAQIEIEKEILSKIFSADDIRNNKSCKKLRDALNHKINVEDIYEINNRYDELINYMEIFLNKFR